MKKILAVFLISSSIALSLIAFGVGNRPATTGPNPNADSFSQGPAIDTSSVIVQLKGDPLTYLFWYQADTRQKNRFQQQCRAIISCPVERWAQQIQTMAALKRTRSKQLRASTISRLMESRFSLTGRHLRRSPQRRWWSGPSTPPFIIPP